MLNSRSVAKLMQIKSKIRSGEAQLIMKKPKELILIGDKPADVACDDLLEQRKQSRNLVEKDMAK